MFTLHRLIARLLIAAAIPVALVLPAPASAAADDPVKVVYHLSEGTAQASRAIANMRNHLAADPKAKIVVVTHGAGIDFLLDGAADAKGAPFSGSIADLANRGVEFKVCNNTLEARGIAKDKVAMEAQIVPSGVAEVARLQAKQGFVYLHP
jgi:intracellular sulfur oxidation DsrE/DsrF family protein